MTDDERDPDYEPAPFLVRERLRGTVAEVAACFERFATEYHAQFAFVPGERRLIEHSEHKATLLIRSGRHYDGGNGHMFPDPYLYVTVRDTPNGALLETEMTTPGYDVSGNLTSIFEELRAQLVAEGFIGDETRQPAQMGAGAIVVKQNRGAFVVMIQDLIDSTPELTQAQRTAYFGALSEREQRELAELFRRANKTQRQKLYYQLAAWLQESHGRSN